MDLALYEEMKQCLERLTHSGGMSLSEEDMKRLKAICKRSDDYVGNCHTLLMQYLKEDHAEVRLSSVQVIDQLFRKSHHFREELAGTFQEFLVLAIGVDPNQPLPPPAGVAKMLKEKCLLVVKEWYEKYGDGYPKLRLGYQYLNHNLRVNFDDLIAESETRRRRIEDQEEKMRLIREQRLLTARNALQGKLKEINDVVTQMTSCFNLLLPRLDQPDLYFSPEMGSTVARVTKAAVYGDGGESDVCDSGSDIGDSGGDNCTGGDGDISDKCVCGGDDSDVVVGNGRDVIDGGDGDIGDGGDGGDGSGEGSGEESESEWVDVSDTEDEEHRRSYTQEEDLQTHGIPGRGYSVTVELLRSGQVVVEETEDNVSILNTLRDCVCVIKQQFLPFIQQQIEVFTKLHGSRSDIQSALDIREELLASLQKYGDLKIVDSSGRLLPTKYDDGQQLKDQDSRAVGKVNSQVEMLPSSTEWTPNKSFITSEVEATDPTSIAAQLRATGREPKGKQLSTKDQLSSLSHSSGASSRKESLLAQAPLVPFDKDLMHWENPEECPGPAVIPLESLHRFWVPDHEVILTPGDNNRIINFTGTFEPVTKACRAPLPSGRLCPRKDRHKCPLHGLIIPRDERGMPVDKDGQPSTFKNPTSIGNVESSDPQEQLWKKVSKEVSHVLGVDMRSEGGNSKGKGKKPSRKRKNPGLTDLKTLNNTSRKRLEKIILNKKSLERVANSLDRLDAKKFDDKFGNNYNYSLRK